jgi:hypothetical protein
MGGKVFYVVVIEEEYYDMKEGMLTVLLLTQNTFIYLVFYIFIDLNKTFCEGF